MTSTCTIWSPLPLRDRFWAVGCQPAYLVHRIIGEWCGNDAYRTMCGSNICLHAEFAGADWPFPAGGMSFDDVWEIPTRYRLCLKCVRDDDTVE